MKPNSRSKGRFHTNWVADAPTTDQILNRIRAMTWELDALQAEICDQISREPGQAHASEAQALSDFKVSLDRLRNALWFYLEHLAGKTDMPVPRKACASEPQRLVAYPQAIGDSAGISGSFFDRLDVVVDAYMKNAGPREAPGKSEKGQELS
jgi:hypothetical protein